MALGQLDLVVAFSIGFGTEHAILRFLGSVAIGALERDNGLQALACHGIGNATTKDVHHRLSHGRHNDRCLIGLFAFDGHHFRSVGRFHVLIPFRIVAFAFDADLIRAGSDVQLVDAIGDLDLVNGKPLLCGVALVVGHTVNAPCHYPAVCHRCTIVKLDTTGDPCAEVTLLTAACCVALFGNLDHPSLIGHEVRADHPCFDFRLIATGANGRPRNQAVFGACHAVRTRYECKSDRTVNVGFSLCLILIAYVHPADIARPGNDDDAILLRLDRQNLDSCTVGLAIGVHGAHEKRVRARTNVTRIPQVLAAFTVACRNGRDLRELAHVLRLSFRTEDLELRSLIAFARFVPHERNDRRANGIGHLGIEFDGCQRSRSTCRCCEHEHKDRCETRRQVLQ